ncbi:MAG: LuxR C-terminal-related transcriptional regulator [Pseudomonadota bacterium]|nr:LuxR C-terminal-related transcriptional regulator [Pseudomonadota bacterium]
MANDIEFAFDHAPVGIVVTRYRQIERYNPHFAKMFAAEAEDLTGRSLSLLYPTEQEYVDIGTIGRREMERDGTYRDARIMQRRDGNQFWCQVLGQTNQRSDPFTHCVWTFVDLSGERPVVDLTRREREVALFVVRGAANKDIALALGISHRTVEAHRSRIAAKLDARTTAEMIAKLGGVPLG